MLIMTRTLLTSAARQKAIESTGKDPGANVLRLHRDNCPRIDGRDKETLPADEADARDVWNAKPCTRCSPAKQAVLTAKQTARKALQEHEDSVRQSELEAFTRQVRQEPEAAPAGNVVSLGNLEVFAGPPATRDIRGRVKPIRLAAYPEVKSGPLHCAGCREDKPATTFQFVTKKGDGKGRMVECTPCQLERLEWNKSHPDDKRKSPKFTLEQVANGI